MIRRVVFAVVILSAGWMVGRAQHQVLPDFEADPSARVFHGRLYVYPSHDIAGSKDWDMVDWHVFSTGDMVHWKDDGVSAQGGRRRVDSVVEMGRRLGRVRGVSGSLRCGGKSAAFGRDDGMNWRVRAGLWDVGVAGGESRRN